MTQIEKLQNDKTEIDFQYYIHLTFAEDISWETLGILFENLTQTLEQSKELNKILLEELRASESKLKNRIKILNNVKDTSSFEEIENEVQTIEVNNLKSSEHINDHNFDSNESVEQVVEVDQEEENIVADENQVLNSKSKNVHEQCENESQIKSDMPEQEVDLESMKSKDLQLQHEIEEHSKNNYEVMIDQIDVPKDNKKFQCKNCDKSFVLKGGLKRHENIHMQNNPYRCVICSKAFSNISDLKRHELIHKGGEKEFQCEICKKSFTKLLYLRNHETIHSGIKPARQFECKKCNKFFSQTGRLKEHERIHTGEKPFMCKTCEKAFSRLDNFKAHIMIHTSEKLYTCVTCKQKFLHKRSLKSHEKRKHSVQLASKILNNIE